MVIATHEVILIEDDRGMRQAVERMMRGSGYRVEAYESAESLLDALEGTSLWNSVRCLVCDVRLPGVSGFELHRRLAEQGPMPPWIFITAHDDPAVRRQAERACTAYLLKPFEGKALVALVASALRT
ncbi:response regulator [Pseudoxanthomonas sp. UTMC 1351]|uniref:response regulator n=1 Tax=Pseudoxanthomonas sp. UTMC 1351 TaxID=2695853 RepID=UPI0034CD121F